jgi:DNA-binding NarL/FixJ family response regulator
MDSRPYRVIIIDDEPALLSVLKEYIETRRGPEECVVETARDGSAGLDLLVRHRPDLVILDIDMPGPNGIVVLRKIRNLDPTIPVVMLTGKADAAQAGETLKDGAVMYAPKPLDLRYLDHLLALYCAPSA